MKVGVAIAVVLVATAVWVWQRMSTQPAALEPALPLGSAAAQAPAGIESTGDARIPSAGLREHVPAIGATNESSPGSEEEAVAETEDWPGTCTLHGLITDERGEPIQLGYALSAYDEQGRGVTGQLRGARYRFVDLAPARYWIETNTHEFVSPHRLVDVLHSEEGRRVDLVLERAQLVDVLLFALDGRPLAEVVGPYWKDDRLDIALTAEPPDEVIHRGREYSRVLSKQFQRSTGAKWGTLRVTEPRPVYASIVFGASVVATEVVVAGARDLSFFVDPDSLEDHWASLRLLVLDAEGVPAPRASVIVSVHGHFRMEEGGGDGGRWHFEELEPGRCQLLIHLTGHRLVTRDLDLPRGLTDLGRVELERAKRRRGLVVDESGNPVQIDDGRVRINLRRKGKRDKAARGAIIGLSVDEKGEFTLDFEGEVVVQAEGDDVISSTVVVREDDPEGEVRLVVRPKSAVVLEPTGDGWHGLQYELLDESGELAGESGTLTRAAPLRLACAPGSYTLVLRDATGAKVAEHACTVWSEPLVVEVP